MPTKTDVGNIALVLCGQGVVTQIDQTNERGRIILAAYRRAAAYCLERHSWNFALEMETLGKTTAPAFHWAYAYNKPAEWIKTHRISDDPNWEHNPHLKYRDQRGLILTNAENIYLTFVSTDAIDHPGRWTESFGYYVGVEIAVLIHERFGVSKTRMKELMGMRDDVRLTAISFDASQGPTQERPMGRFASARRGGRR